MTSTIRPNTTREIPAQPAKPAIAFRTVSPQPPGKDSPEGCSLFIVSWCRGWLGRGYPTFRREMLALAALGYHLCGVRVLGVVSRLGSGRGLPGGLLCFYVRAWHVVERLAVFAGGRVREPVVAQRGVGL